MPPVIATQLPPAMNELIARRVPVARLLPVPAGPAVDLPAEATIFFAAPARTIAMPPADTQAAWTSRVQWVQLLSAGADGYPTFYFEVPCVTSSRGPTARPVAEFALAAIFAYAKRMPQVWINDAGDWKPQTLGMLEGSTLGIVGYGAIGQLLARLGKALGMRVIVARRQAPEPGSSVEFMTITEVIAQSDQLVIAAASTPETRHMIDRENLRRAKSGLHLVNVARGPLIDDEALLEALDEGRIACASLDVTDPEPLPAGHRLYSHPRVRLSPHLSSYDPTLFDRLAHGFADNLERFVRGEPLHNVVDPARGY